MTTTQGLETIPVSEIMSTEFDTVTTDVTLQDAARMLRGRRGTALIVDTGDDSPSIISEFNIVKAVEDFGDVAARTVGDHMTHVVVAGEPDWPLSRALDTMLQGGFRHLVVMDNGKVVGMLRLRDIFIQITGDDFHAEPEQDTAEIGASMADELARVIQQYRRSAKQHWVSIKCPCQLDWLEILIGQAETRSDLTIEEIGKLWEQRQPCPALHEGGAGD